MIRKLTITIEETDGRVTVHELDPMLSGVEADSAMPFGWGRTRRVFVRGILLHTETTEPDVDPGQTDLFETGEQP